MVQQRRRVSYVIPAPTEIVPPLQLPPHGVSRLGLTGPLLIPLATNVSTSEPQAPKRTKHPRHRLGVTSLALDTSTQLVGRGSPEGILYSGGRDGLIISWDLGIPMKRRKLSEDNGLRRTRGRWETLTGWADNVTDEESEDGDDRLQSDGDILGDVTMSGRRRKRRYPAVVPYENQWETDLVAFKYGRPSEFRQCAQAHADWVNDILLCNLNQTIVSASSDGTVKAWNPHSPNPTDPSTIGSHNDYVRCLAHSREQNWVASGSFDRTVKLWDLTRSEQHDPLTTLNPPDANAPKSSIYALATDPFGTTIASGSPERVVRLWDPRTGKRTGKLVGHTDNIRAILMSEDSKYLLTGSADASIKLWSLSSQRCLHTFTHHTESVWSLHSSHPTLEIFYSGDRSGLVCKIDVENCSDMSEAECILLCQDADPATPSSAGINKIVAMDDNLLWTASGHSNIKRWKAPQRQAVRAASLLSDVEYQNESPTQLKRNDSSELPSEASTRPSTAHSLRASVASSVQSLTSDAWQTLRDTDANVRLYGIPFESLVKLISPNEPFISYSPGRGRDADVATLYSAASVRSVPRTHALRSAGASSAFKLPHTSRTEDTAQPVHTARAAYEERELASDAVPLYAEPEDIIPGDHGLVRSVILNDRLHALTVDTAGEVAVWDIVRGLCVGRFLREDVATVSNGGSWAGGSGGDKERSPREALEAVRERVEGEAVVSSWSTADTKAGVLAIHLTEKCFEAEVYADEVGYIGDRRFNDESKINIGKWVLRNLFLGFIREEQRTRRGRVDSFSDGASAPSDMPTKTSPSHARTRRRSSAATSTNFTVVRSPKMIPALPPTDAPPATRASPLLTPMIPLHVKELNLPLPSQPISQPPGINDGATPMPRRLRSATVDDTPVATTGSPHNDYFSVRARQPSLSGGMPPTPEDFSGWAGPGKTEPHTPSTPGPGPGGLMGRLKSFGKMSGKRPAGEVLNSPVVGSLVPSAVVTEEPETDNVKTPVQALLLGSLNPPPSSEAPTYSIPGNTTLLISEETAPSFTTVYRGTVSSTKHDIQALEEAMPLWLVEYLLMNKLPPLTTHPKISFILLPWPTKNPEDQLPELLNTAQSKLTANRYLRVRKLVSHVQEKLDKISPPPAKSEPAYEDYEPPPHPRAEEAYEILCNDVLLHLNMSLAVVRQYIWKQSTELTMYYRRKSHSDTESVP